MCDVRRKLGFPCKKPERPINKPIASAIDMPTQCSLPIPMAIDDGRLIFLNSALMAPMPHAPYGNLERRNLRRPGRYKQPNILTQMIFELIHYFGRLDTSRSHLPPPVGDFLVKIKHIVPSTTV